MLKVLRHIPAVAFFAAPLVPCGPAFGGSSNHGGDEVRLLFEDARGVAKSMAAEFAGAPAGVATSAAVLSWIHDHAAGLADDIAGSPHLWPDQISASTCAQTGSTGASPIIFSFVICRDVDQFTSKTQAARLLVHESVHHFHASVQQTGIEEEAFADQVAVTLAAAYTLHASTAVRYFDGESLSLTVAVAPDIQWPSKKITRMGDKIFICCESVHAESDPAGVSSYKAGVIYDPLTKTGQRTSPTLMLDSSSEDPISDPFWNGREIIWVRDMRVGRYNPKTDEWAWGAKQFDPNALAERDNTVVATKDAVYLWGGRILVPGSHGFDGAIASYVWKDETRGFKYDLASATWSQMSMTNGPSVTYGMQAFWTGEAGNPSASNRIVAYEMGSSRGYIYDLSHSSWQKISGVGAPAHRADGTVTFTGQELIVWGGRSTATGISGDGAIYRFAENAWHPMKAGPTARALHSAAATPDGTLLIWGGTSAGATPLGDGYAYDISGDTWEKMAFDQYSPDPRYGHESVWAGGALWLFGGQNDGVAGTVDILTPR